MLYQIKSFPFFFSNKGKILESADGEGTVVKAGSDDHKRITVTLTTLKDRNGSAQMLPPWVVLHGKSGKTFKKTT